MIFFNRQAQLFLGNKLYSSDDLDFEFNIPFSTKSEPSISEVVIYNLSPSSIANIKKGTRLTLHAGYKDDLGLLTSGAVSEYNTVLDGVDKKTTLKVASAIVNWKEQKIQKTFAPGTTAKELLQDILPQFGIPIGDLSPAKNITYQKGRTVSGRLKDVVMSIAKETDSKFYIDRDKCYFREPNKGNPTGFVLSGETGLLGSPERIEIEKKEGWKIKCLLNYQITVDTVIQVKSKVISGMFRVVKGKHSSEWITEMEVVPK